MSNQEIWGTAHKKPTDIQFREPIPNSRVVRYIGEFGGLTNPILFPMADFEKVEMFKKTDPEPEKLEELWVEKITTTFGKDYYAIPGKDIVLKDLVGNVCPIDKKRFKRIYVVTVSEECARLCVENNNFMKKKKGKEMSEEDPSWE